MDFGVTLLARKQEVTNIKVDDVTSGPAIIIAEPCKEYVWRARGHAAFRALRVSRHSPRAKSLNKSYLQIAEIELVRDAECRALLLSFIFLHTTSSH